MYFEKVLGGEKRVIIKFFPAFQILEIFLSFTVTLILHLFLLTIRGIKNAEMKKKKKKRSVFLNTPFGELFVHIFMFLSGFGLSFYSKVPISWLTYCSGRTPGSCRPGTRQAGWLRGESCCISLPAADTTLWEFPWYWKIGKCCGITLNIYWCANRIVPPGSNKHYKTSLP